MTPALSSAPAREPQSDGRMPPLTGILLAAATAATLWAAIVTAFFH